MRHGRPNRASPCVRLVIDDNATARDVLARMGHSLGWEVEVADSGARGIEMLRAASSQRRDYQAVFVDWQMPGLDGWQTSRRIRELGLQRQVPVVVMVTAHGREMMATRDATEQSLVDRFLVKPVTASMLFDAVVDARSEQARPHPSTRRGAPPQRRLDGLRLLVVEDNLNNQQIARELLGGRGCRRSSLPATDSRVWRRLQPPTRRSIWS